MKFCWTTLNINNMDESVAFYKDIIGLSVMRRFVAGPGVEICFLGEGETQVELIYDMNRKSIVSSDGISLGFEVESMDAIIQFIEQKGIQVENGPYKPNPNVQFFYVKDPNGVNIQFVENIK